MYSHIDVENINFQKLRTLNMEATYYLKFSAVKNSNIFRSFDGLSCFSFDENIVWKKTLYHSGQLIAFYKLVYIILKTETYTWTIILADRYLNGLHHKLFDCFCCLDSFISIENMDT